MPPGATFGKHRPRRTVPRFLKRARIVCGNPKGGNGFFKKNRVPAIGRGRPLRRRSRHEGDRREIPLQIGQGGLMGEREREPDILVDAGQLPDHLRQAGRGRGGAPLGRLPFIRCVGIHGRLQKGCWFFGFGKEGIHKGQALPEMKNPLLFGQWVAVQKKVSDFSPIVFLLPDPCRDALQRGLRRSGGALSACRPPSRRQSSRPIAPKGSRWQSLQWW